jgi:ethanolamine utilization protein EutN
VRGGVRRLYVDARLRACKPDGAFDGDRYVVAVDLVGAGVGETVLVEDEGTSARQLLDAKDAPVRSVIVGIVDEVALSPGG